MYAIGYFGGVPALFLGRRLAVVSFARGDNRPCVSPIGSCRAGAGASDISATTVFLEPMRGLVGYPVDRLDFCLKIIDLDEFTMREGNANMPARPALHLDHSELRFWFDILNVALCDKGVPPSRAKFGCNNRTSPLPLVAVPCLRIEVGLIAVLVSGRACATCPGAMTAISVTREAFEAIRATLPEAQTSEPQPDGRGEVRIWLDRKYVDRLKAMRGPGESYSDVILRLAAE